MIWSLKSFMFSPSLLPPVSSFQCSSLVAAPFPAVEAVVSFSPETTCRVILESKIHWKQKVNFTNKRKKRMQENVIPSHHSFMIRRCFELYLFHTLFFFVLCHVFMTSRFFAAFDTLCSHNKHLKIKSKHWSRECIKNCMT